MPGALNRHGQLSLMAGAGAGDTAGHNLGPVGEESPQLRHVLVINMVGLVHAEGADLPAGPSGAASLFSALTGL